MRLATLAVALVVASLAGHAQEPVFRAGVDLVTVDAIVVDKDGRPVTGLTADDFILTVDGKPRTIDAFELVAVRATDAPADRRLPDVSSNDVAEPGRLIFLVIDRNNMSVGDGRASLDGLKGLVENLSPRDRLGLVTLPGGGPMIQPTSDHGAVLEALRRVRGLQQRNPDPTLAMTMSEALRIEHPAGYEVREDFAARAQANVRDFLGEEALARYRVEIRDDLRRHRRDRPGPGGPRPARAVAASVPHVAKALVPVGSSSPTPPRSSRSASCARTWTTPASSRPRPSRSCSAPGTWTAWPSDRTTAWWPTPGS